jgi:hypothetical protein
MIRFSFNSRNTMLRFLLIFGLILFVVYKIGSLFFRAGAASQQLRDQQRRNVNGTSNPPKTKGNAHSKKAGDYIDYEEVK